MSMFPTCDNCGERTKGNIDRVMEEGDQVDYCQTCGAETQRIEDIASKRADTTRF